VNATRNQSAPNGVRGSLLGQIQADVLDESKPLAGILRKCIVLGGEVGSASLRDWASRESKGYDGADLPEYRVVYAQLTVDAVTTSAVIKGQPISARFLPDFVAEHISERLELRQGVGQLEALAASRDATDDSIKLSIPDGTTVASYMNSKNDNPYQRIQAIYWSVAPAVVRGVIDNIRTALAEIVAELRAGLPEGEEVPSADLANQAINIAVNGNKARVTVTSAQASAGSNASIGTAQPAEKNRG
jgi:hypothetical protein